MVRETMTEIVQATRELVGDVATPPQFTDEAIQAVLDRHSERVRQEQLTGIEAQTPTGTITTEFEGYGPFEADVDLADGNYQSVTAETSDNMVALYTFTTEPAEQTIYISGTRYNIEHAAADLCEQWATQLLTQGDFKSDDFSITSSKTAEILLKRAADLRDRTETVDNLTPTIGTMSLIRSDVRSSW